MNRQDIKSRRQIFCFYPVIAYNSGLDQFTENVVYKNIFVSMVVNFQIIVTRIWVHKKIFVYFDFFPNNRRKGRSRKGMYIWPIAATIFHLYIVGRIGLQSRNYHRSPINWAKSKIIWHIRGFNRDWPTIWQPVVRPWKFYRTVRNVRTCQIERWLAASDRIGGKGYFRWKFNRTICPNLYRLRLRWS